MALTTDPDKIRKRAGRYFFCANCGVEDYAAPNQNRRQYCSIACKTEARAKLGEPAAAPPKKRVPKSAPGLRRKEFDDTALAKLKW